MSCSRIRSPGGSARLIARIAVGAGRGALDSLYIGWVVGHSYIVSGPLLRARTTIFYEASRSATP